LPGGLDVRLPTSKVWLARRKRISAVPVGMPPGWRDYGHWAAASKNRLNAFTRCNRDGAVPTQTSLASVSAGTSAASHRWIRMVRNRSVGHDASRARQSPVRWKRPPQCVERRFAVQLRPRALRRAGGCLAPEKWCHLLNFDAPQGGAGDDR